MKHKMIERVAESCRASQRGGTLVLVTVFMVALFGFAALSVDVGNVLVQRTRIQEAGDSAALASVVDWATGATAAAVAQRAKSFASANGVLTNEVKTVRVGKWDNSTKTFTEQATFTSSDVPAVEVTNQRVVPTYFAKVVGLPSMSPRTVSVAVAAASRGAGGALPWSMCNDEPTPVKCDIIVIKKKGGNDCASRGNYDALALGGTGSDNYRDNIVTGFPGILHVGDIVDTEPGNMVGPTKQGLDDRLSGVPPYVCTPTSPPPTGPRLAIIPVTTPYTKNGRAQAQITGFYTVALRDYSGGGNVEIQFVEVFNGTEVDPSAPPAVGMLNGVALVK
jgi:Flp pilus assembly protein TadG